jgi:hypothetical protein
MNYRNYERQIVEKYGVALTGWPIHGYIRNPGELTRDDTTILLNALTDDKCKWRKYTEAEVSYRKLSNKQRVANGEPVYGPDRRGRTRKVHVIDSEMQVDDHVVNENTA